MAERLAGQGAEGERPVFPEELGAEASCYTCIAGGSRCSHCAWRRRSRNGLRALARKTGRTKSFYAREAILRHLDDIEDAHLARERLGRRRGRVSLEALEKELGAGPAK